MVEVRKAHTEDLPELGRIMAVSFRSAFGGFISQETLEACAVAENCAGLLQQLHGAGEMEILAGLVDGRLRGLLVWQGNTLEAIHSLPESWGSGLGGAMLTAALERMPRPVTLWAFQENARARRFYEKHGFVFTGQQRISAFDGAVEVCYALG